MKIEYEPLFIRNRDKLIKRGAITQKQLDNTIELFKSNEFHSSLYNHKIKCKKDKYRRSIALLESNQKYKILFADFGELKKFVIIEHHDRYDRYNRNC